MADSKRLGSRATEVSGERKGFLDGVTLNRSFPLREQIYGIVRRAIVTGRLLPGSAINEIEIAEKLGLSRTPVREAVKKISDEGLVDVMAQAGTFVAEISRSQVEEAYIIRIALEAESVARAAPLVNETHVDNLEDIIHRHDAALRRGWFDEAIARDDDFHRSIAEISGLTTLWKVVDNCKAQMDRCRLQTLPTPGHGSETIKQHRAIVAALSTKKVRPSVQALRVHLNTSLQNSLAWFAQQHRVE
jgi:GntR family transcriptional regulator, rspAB operon transcriptional repressor